MQPPSPTSLALVMCVHNEAPFLAANLAYHHAVGVSRAYVFADRCTDATEDIARSFPWVKVIRRDQRAGLRFMREHQNECCRLAIAMARDEGIEWLLHIDADELAFGGTPLRADPDKRENRLVARLSRKRRLRDALGRASLTGMLATVAPGTIQVTLPTHEALPMHASTESDFWRNPYFQTGTPMKQKILDPVIGQKIKHDRLLGHDQGKSIVRTAAADTIEPLNPHRWTVRQNTAPPDFPEDIPLATETRGCHFHYLVVTPAQWLKKYRQFDHLAEHWPSGVPLSFPKGTWRRATLTMSESEAAEYLGAWVFREREALDALVRSGDALLEPDAATILESLNVR